jgi:hypothetical protein
MVIEDLKKCLLNEKKKTGLNISGANCLRDR